MPELMEDKDLVIEQREDSVSLDDMESFSKGMARLPYVLGELGYESMRPGQDKAVKSIMSGRDTVTILPTATGKSACFVIPTLCMDWRTIVIYPLVALIRDQAKSMQHAGLSVASISSHESEAHNAAVLRDWASGQLQFMLVSPERFANAEWANVVSQFPPDFVAMDECFTPDVEILTESGFMTFGDLIGDDAGSRSERAKVAQVDPLTGEITYTRPTKFVRRHHDGDIIDITNESGIDLSVTPNHDLLVYRKDGSHAKRRAGEAKFSNMWRMRAAGDGCKGHDRLTPAERLQIAFQADGNAHSKTSASFSFTKPRKIGRFITLMNDGAFDYNEVADSRPGRRRFIVTGVPGLTKLMRDSLDYRKFSSEGCRNIIREAITWDDRDVSENLGYYSSIVEDNVSFYQEVCIRAGWRARKTVQVDDRKDTFSDVHRLFIRKVGPWVDTQNFEKKSRPYKGNVYCVSVPTGCIIVRRSGKAVVVGNCHTFNDWADTFRPGYKFAGKFIQDVSPKVVAAFSATLNEDAEAEVREGLGIQGARLVYHYPRRQNLHLETMYVERITEAAPWVAANCHGPTVVYATSRKRAEEYADSISRFTDRPVYFYHGGMNANDRKYQMDKFMRDPDAIICATNAFGMGVDKPNIRQVIHFDMPTTLVALAQEIGRAGRDGLDSRCIIIPHPKAVQTCRFFIRCGNPTQQEIRDFWEAAYNLREGRNGAVTATRDKIASEAGTDPFVTPAIMSFCLGEGMMAHDTDAARQSRLKFLPDIPSLTKTESETRNAIFDVSYEEDGWLHVDIDALSEQLQREPATIMSRLRKMQKDGKIEWVRASTKKPLRMLKTPDEIPIESFERLDAKAAKANSDLQMVLDYCETMDEDKHSFLESHLNR